MTTERLPVPRGIRSAAAGLVALAVALIVAAPQTAPAHGGDPDNGGPGKGEAEAPSPSRSPAAALTPPFATAPVDHAVAVAGYAFTPGSIAINAGDSVVWTWSGRDVDHSVTSSPGQPESFDSHPGTSRGTVTAPPPGGSLRHTFTTPGTFAYVCRVHPRMTGSISVSPAGTAPAPAAATVAAPPVAPPAQPARPRTVTVAEYAFAPALLAVDPGGSVTWRWTGSDRDHSVTSVAGQAETFDSHSGVPTAQITGPPPNSAFTRTFEAPGRFRYFCRVHPAMTATVAVGLAARPRLTAVAARLVGDVVHVRYRLDRAASVRATIFGGGRSVRRYVFRDRRGTRSHRLAIRGPQPRRRLIVAVQATTSRGLSRRVVVPVADPLNTSRARNAAGSRTQPRGL